MKIAGAGIISFVGNNPSTGCIYVSVGCMFITIGLANDNNENEK
jgi:hypothetical protein